jgi:hypothetical protein
LPSATAIRVIGCGFPIPNRHYLPIDISKIIKRLVKGAVIHGSMPVGENVALAGIYDSLDV